MSFQRTYRRLRFGSSIVVVSGLPRSGTSMAMRMLAAGGMPLVADDIRAADDDNPRGYFEDERVKHLGEGLDKSWLRGARGKAIKIIASLLDDLPDWNNYRVVFMHRDLREILASQATMLARRGETSETSDERMLELFEQHLIRVEAALRARGCFEVCDVEYAAVIRAPRDNAARIGAFLGRQLDLDGMAGAVDRALYRNRAQPGRVEG